MARNMNTDLVANPINQRGWGVTTGDQLNPYLPSMKKIRDTYVTENIAYNYVGQQKRQHDIGRVIVIKLI